MPIPAPRAAERANEDRPAEVDPRELNLLMPLERALREWRGTFDAIEWPIVIVDRALRVRRLNQATLQAVGGSYSGWIGRHVATFGAGQPWLGAASLVDRLFTTGRPAVEQIEDFSTRQTWEISVRGVETGAESTEAAVVVVRDISRVISLEESLRHSETMAAMGSLLASVAHEVRNPLFAISSILDAWTVRGAGANVPAYQAVLRKEVDRLRDLMAELLEYGRPYSSDLRAGEIAEVIGEAVATCGTLAGQRNVEVRTAVPRSLVPMNRGRMCRVFINLVQNAIQHAPAGTDVLIEAEAQGSAASPTLQITIRDAGPGFAAEDLPSAFCPFFSRRKGGTGLGLAIVRRIVEEHHGTVTVGNDPRGGAIVHLVLPACR